MIGFLPKTLKVKDKDYPIRTDFRIGLLAIQVYNDIDLTDNEKAYLLLDMFYGIDNLKREDYEDALKQITWFIDGGRDYTTNKAQKKVIDWEQDESMIFSAINKVAGKEVREVDYIHWWTFLGYFNEIGEGLFSTIVHIRQKRANGKKLTKEEQEFMAKNKDLVVLKKKYSQEEKEEMEKLNKLLG